RRYARLETREHTQNDHSLTTQLLTDIESEWRPQISLSREPESGRHNPDDRPALVSQRKRPTNHLRIAAETAPPQAVARDYNCRAARRVFRRHKIATERRLNAERLKQTGRDEASRQPLRLAASCKVGGIGGVSGDPFKHFRLITPLQKIRA